MIVKSKIQSTKGFGGMVNTRRRRIAQCARPLMRCEHVNGHPAALACLAASCGVSMAWAIWGKCGNPSGLFIGEDSLSMAFIAAWDYTGNCITGGPVEMKMRNVEEPKGGTKPGNVWLLQYLKWSLIN